MNKLWKKISVSAMILAVSLSLVACTTATLSTDSDFGSKLPYGVKGKHSINANMSAVEMYSRGVQNFDEAKYVAQQQKGNIVSSSPVGDQRQTINNIKIKTKDVSYAETNILSQSTFIKNIVEQSILDRSGLRGRTASKVKKKDDEAVVSKWKKVDKYSSLKAGLKHYPNDPTSINFYEVSKSTVLKATKPVYDNKTKQYTFTLELDPIKATKNYIPYMEHNSVIGGMNRPKITFETLVIDVTMWSNGLIKQIESKESYKVNGNAPVVGNTTARTQFNAVTYYSYDPKSMDINEYLTF